MSREQLGGRVQVSGICEPLTLGSKPWGAVQAGMELLGGQVQGSTLSSLES